MSFAKRQLEKFGWKEGQGIGKKMQGSTKSVFIAKKNDTAGLGSSSKADLYAPWWDDVYAQAAARIVSIEQPEESAEEEEAMNPEEKALDPEKKEIDPEKKAMNPEKKEIDPTLNRDLDTKKSHSTKSKDLHKKSKRKKYSSHSKSQV